MTAPRPPRPKHGLRAKLLLAAAALFSAAAVGEVALRLLGWPPQEFVFLPKDGSVDWDCYCSNYRDYFKPRTLEDGRTVFCVDHTNQPARVRDLAAAQANGAFTVLTVGDSFTYGLGVKVADNWPSRLEKPIAELVGKPVVVSNVGAVGRHVMEVFEGQYKPHAAGESNPPPDLCVYGWCLNDPWWQPAESTLSKKSAERTNPLAPTAVAEKMDNGAIDDFINLRTANLQQLRLESSTGWLRKRLRVVDLPFRAWESREIHRRTLQFYFDLYDSQKNADGLAITWNAVQRMSDAQKSAGKRFLVAIFPMFVDLEGGYPLAPIHAKIVEELTQRKIPVVDLLPVFRGQRSSQFWVHPVDRHPNDAAHQLAANEIARAVERTPKG